MMTMSKRWLEMGRVMACLTLVGAMLPLSVHGAGGFSTVYGVLTVMNPEPAAHGGSAEAGGLVIAAAGSLAVTRADGSFHLNAVPGGRQTFHIRHGDHDAGSRRRFRSPDPAQQQRGAQAAS